MRAGLTSFDPNEAAPPDDNSLFAVPYTVAESEVVVVPVGWDATSSQDRVAAGSPVTVREVSKYVELHDPALGAFYTRGIAMDDADTAIGDLNATAVTLFADADLSGLEHACRQLNDIVRKRVAEHLENDKRVGLLGGDHSVSFGSLVAHLERDDGLGVLQIDAHCDLRPGFEGVRYSHASVMYNVIEELKLDSLVQVGVRALCDAEAHYAHGSPRVRTFFDNELHARRAAGDSWRTVCDLIVAALPENVYVSLDIDGLEPALCPHTGTPVPGGLSYNDVVYLLHRVRASGRRITGFDLVEIGDHPSDALIGAHLLYQLCGLVSASTTNS